jgi:hypothetical protein
MATAPPTVFRRRKWVLIVYLVFGIAIGIQGIATAIWFAVFAEGVEAWLRPVSIGLALFLVWLGYFFGGEAFRRLRDPKAPIAIGPAGLHDRAISGRPIPWNAIRDLHVWDGGARGGRCLVFDIEDNAARDAGVHLRVRNSAPVNRPFGYGYRVHTLGTDANIEALTQAIAPYATVKL